MSCIGRHIAEQLALNYVFFCEFEEMYSPLRSPELQVCDTLLNVLPFEFSGKLNVIRKGTLQIKVLPGFVACRVAVCMAMPC